jgi:tetratricopeptide (TPR) repeat protein
VLNRWLTTSVLASALCLSALAQAQPKKAAGTAEPRRDPSGVKGISPFWESMKKGDNAYVARDYEGAIAGYRDAITKEPQNPAGHYRMGEAHLAKGDQKEAEASWVAGLRYVGQNHTLKAKLLFVLADLRERQKAYDDATEGWTKYEGFAREQPQSKTYPATAVERKKRVADWKKLTEEYKAVKERIERRLKEADEKARKSAK